MKVCVLMHQMINLKDSSITNTGRREGTYW